MLAIAEQMIQYRGVLATDLSSACDLSSSALSADEESKTRMPPTPTPTEAASTRAARPSHRWSSAQLKPSARSRKSTSARSDAQPCLLFFAAATVDLILCSLTVSLDTSAVMFD